MIQTRPLLLAAGFACLVAISLYVAPAANAGGIAATNDLSAQTNTDKTKRTVTTTRPVTTTRVVRQKNVPTTRPRTRNTVTTTTRTRTTIKTGGATGGARITTAPKTTIKNVTQVRKGPPRAVTFTGQRTVIGGRLRGVRAGTGRYVVHGRNFSYWRGGPYRVRHGNGWRTFVALGALSAIAVGSTTYYPYAYISAPQDICEGLTEDGCQMTWQDVETVEGGVAPQCVAYCPWQE
jgi:hypothetical protein